MVGPGLDERQLHNALESLVLDGSVPAHSVLATLCFNQLPKRVLPSPLGHFGVGSGQIRPGNV
jgi:hypothetical protein